MQDETPNQSSMIMANASPSGNNPPRAASLSNPPPTAASVPRSQPSPSPIPSPEASAEPAPWFGWSRRDQAVIAGLVLLVLVLMGVQWLRLSRWGEAGRPIEVESLDPIRLNYKLDINRATWVEFVQLDAVGEVLAHRIVADREENGPFDSVDDLRRVRGIGAKTLEKLRPWLTVTAPTEPAKTPD